jgi:serine phosphatase RsbU (regulator of sigma subunit)
LNYALEFFARTLNTLKNIKSEFIHGKEIKWEVELGKEIQWKMLTKKLIEVPGLDVIVKSKPAWEIGWDSYDIIKEWENYYIYVWDATGHWVWAWFIMIMVNALISWFTKVFTSWANILAKTNEILKPRVKANLLMSLLLVRWDEKEKRIFMTWAWHEYLMIYKHKQQKTFKIKSGWVALWMIKDISKLLKEQEIKFEENDIIILYSDWITEAINKQSKDGTEEMFLEDRLMETINKSPKVTDKNYMSARSVFNNITIELSKFMWYKHVQLDDVTLAVIHYKWKDFDKTKDFPENIKEEYITEWNW